MRFATRNFVAAFTLAGALLIALSAPAQTAPSQAAPGIRPRRSAADYPAQGHAAHVTLAAAQLSSAQVRSTFAAGLDRNYLVIEVALYPTAAGALTISPEDFIVKSGDSYLRPSEPAVVANALQPKPRAASPGGIERRSIDVVPTAEIAHESYPVYGQDGKIHNQGAWVTATGVAVAGPVSNGGSPGYPPGTGASDRDRGVIEAELSDKSLPEGQISQPAAGYLYFPVPAHFKKTKPVTLEYSPGDNPSKADSASLSVPAPPSK